MGIIELILVIVIIGALFGRPRLALGMAFDVVIGILVIALILRLLSLI